MSEVLQAGAAFADYRIEGVLGRGGMGVVYRAEDIRLGRTVALKILAPERADDPAFRDRFLREMRLLASIDHRNIVDVFHAGEADGVLFLAMRFVDGFDLGALIRREGPLAPTVVAHVIAEAAEALDEAHAHGLVHRDVKPGNVLISPRGPELQRARVYLSDFGLTKRAGAESQLTTAGQFLGTPAYVAPEQIQGATIDGRADLYALGCVAYECLTGVPPYHDAGEAAVLMAHLVAPPPDPRIRRPELTPATAAAIARAMAKSRDQRHDRCADFASELREALTGSATALAAPAAPAPGPAPAGEAAPTSAASGPSAVPRPSPAASGADRTQVVPQPVATPAGSAGEGEASPATLVESNEAVADSAPRPSILRHARASTALVRRPRRRAVVGAGGVGVAVVAAAAIAFSGFGAATNPPLSPGSSPGGSLAATQAASSPMAATAAPSTTLDISRPFPDADEARLLRMVPQLTRGTCQRPPTGRADTSGAVAVLECQPSGHLAPSGVRYAMYGGDPALEAAWNSRLAAARAASGVRNEVARCTSPPHTGGYGGFEHGSAPGDVLCYRDDEGRALFVWSVRVLHVLSEAHRADGDAPQLHEWWAQPDRSGPLG